MFGFVTRFVDIYDGNNDISIFEYLHVSHNFPLITPPASTTHIYDVDDVADTDDPLGGQSNVILIQRIGKLHPLLVAQS